MSHEEHLVSRPDCVTGNNPRRTSNVSRETIRAERRLGAREEPPHQSEQHLHQDQDKRHGEQEQEHALRRGPGGELRVRTVLLGQNHGMASRKTLTEATSGSIPGTNERTTAARAGKASRRMKETMYAHLSLTTSDSFMRDIS